MTNECNHESLIKECMDKGIYPCICPDCSENLIIIIDSVTSLQEEYMKLEFMKDMSKNNE